MICSFTGLFYLKHTKLTELCSYFRQNNGHLIIYQSTVIIFAITTISNNKITKQHNSKLRGLFTLWQS